MSAASDRITAARTATMTAEKHVDNLRKALAAERFINAAGVYVDRHKVTSDFGAAKYAIEAAMNAIQGGAWPNAADYAKQRDEP